MKLERKPDRLVLDYLVPDVTKISYPKYKWFSENKSAQGIMQCICCFEYPDNIPQTDGLSVITEQQHTDFGKIIVTVDKKQIRSDGLDSTDISFEFSEAGGSAKFNITKPDGEQSEINIPIPENKIVTLPKSYLTTTKKGTIKVKLSSDKWSNVSGLGETQIEST